MKKEEHQAPPPLYPPIIDRIWMYLIAKKDIPKEELYEMGFSTEQIKAQKKPKKK
jgi:hypothetical protein